MSNVQDYWVNKLSGYADETWVKQPTLFAQEAVKFFPDGGHLLELGAGLSQDSAWFASKGYKVTATDLTKLPTIPAVEALQLDMSLPLPFEPETFDIVYAHLSLHYFPLKRTEQLFNEIYDILKPGGTLAFLVNSIHDPELSEGTEIEPNYRAIKGIQKRFFDIPSTKDFTHKFEATVLDDQGTSHKDHAKGVANLVRFVGNKKNEKSYI